MSDMFRPGQIVELGPHRLMCGDAFNVQHRAELLAGCKADLLYCDPPYGMGLNTQYSRMPAPARMQLSRNIRGGRDYPPVIGDDQPFDPSPLLAAFEGTREQFWWGGDYYAGRLPAGGSWLCWDKRGSEARDRMYGSGFELLWSKRRHQRSLIRVPWAGVFGTEHEPGKRRRHPTHKPVALARWLLERYSKPENAVLDLFAGAGSSLLAAELSGRRAYLMEIDPAYCAVIVERWQDLTAQAARAA